MCDTLVYKGADYTIFAKNSDREPNEAQAILHLPAQSHSGKDLKCTYITIPQVSETFEVLLSKPFQMWGAEMGVNEHGVVIGNEAVFTRIREPKTNSGLTGMDMVRLALERSSCSEDALCMISELVERYGQDACGGYQNRNFYYHNSFLIADPQKLFKLETAGRHWVFKSISTYDSISNGLTIGIDYDGISAKAKTFAYQKKWARKQDEFSFSKAYSDLLYTKLSRCHIRRAVTSGAMVNRIGISVKDAINILKSHYPEPSFEPHKANSGSVCMHPTGLLNPSQTNGSMIVKLVPGKQPEVWITGTSMTCLSVYKPWSFDDPPDTGTVPGPTLDNSLWWRAEKVHREICRDYQKGIDIRDRIMAGFQENVLNNQGSIEKTWGLYNEKLTELESELKRAGLRQMSWNPIYLYHWRKWNRLAGIFQ